MPDDPLVKILAVMVAIVIVLTDPPQWPWQ